MEIIPPSYVYVLCPNAKEYVPQLRSYYMTYVEFFSESAEEYWNTIPYHTK